MDLSVEVLDEIKNYILTLFVNFGAAATFTTIDSQGLAWEGQIIDWSVLILQIPLIM